MDNISLSPIYGIASHLQRVYSHVVYPQSIAPANRRSSTRVAVRLGCHVVWPQGGERIAMFTENISRDGMLLRWEGGGAALPRVGDLLIVEVDLPEQQGFERRCIRCQATVARVQPEEGGSFVWVGLCIHAMDFKVAQCAARDPRVANSAERRERAV